MEAVDIEALGELKIKEEGFYQQTMLLDQVGYLYNMVAGVDQAPSADAQDRFAELQQAFERIKAEYGGE